MRIALGAFSHEANTFSPHLTTRADFEAQRLWRGEALLEGLKGLATEEAGAMSVVGRQGDCQVLPLLSAKALSGGPVLGDVFRSIRDELLERLRAALPVDGVLLVLHGAMMAEGEPDATGEVLRAVREMVGPNVPVVGTLDLHANVTARMVQQATALIGYHTAPHVDAYETGQSAARILLDAVQGKTAPTMALERLPMIVPAENARHTEGPLAEVIGMALATSGPSSMYMVAQHYLGRGKGKSLLMIPAMMLIGVGLAVNNTKAVLEAVLHRESPFYRTPKKGESARLHQQKYRPVKDITPVLELLFGVYCLVCFELFVTHCSIFISPFLVMYAAGFLFVGILSVIHYRAPGLIDYKLKRRVLARTAA